MIARWVAFVVWALVAASAVFWGWRLSMTPLAVPQAAVPASFSGPTVVDLAQLFGRPPQAEVPTAAAPAPSRFKLLGVVTPQQGRDAGIALALISIDDRAAKAYRVGSVVEGQTLLQSVQARGVKLGPQDGPGVHLELPPLIVANTGTLPIATTSGHTAAGSLPGAAAQPMATPFPRPMAVPESLPVVDPGAPEGSTASLPGSQRQLAQ